jgi:cell division protein FtsL
LASNTLLEEKLKDQERQNRQKQKEVEDLRKATAILKSGRMASTRSSIISKRLC